MQFVMWLVLVPMMLTFLKSASSQSGIPGCSPADRAALLGFKASIVKDTTGFLSTWTGDDCCSGGWEGVECGEGGRVNRLMLQSHGGGVLMKGVLSPSLGTLHFLEIMVISGMRRIAGKIPESFSGLTLLTQLVLDDNSLQGTIPSSLGKLRNLQILSLSGNRFNGQISPALGNLRNLLQLNLAKNLLTGPIPQAVGNLRSLHSLDLSFNMLSGSIPDSLGQLQNLTYLVLTRNQFSGQIPVSLCSLVRLSELSLDQNRLVGRIPAQIRDMKSVSVLRLGFNKLTGQIPGSISELHSLWNLNLSRNLLTGSLPDAAFAKGLPSILSIDLSYNDLDLGAVPSWIRNRQLSDVHLAGCKLRGVLPNFTKPDSLATLDLSDNYFTTGISSFLASMASLRTAKISNNLIKADVSTVRLPGQISSLDLHSNLLFGSLLRIPSRYMEVVEVSNNQISGRIPEFVVGMKLKVLNLASNKISGHIPDSVSNLAKLEKFDISRNLITGTIPASLGSFVRLHWLDLSRNELTGRIPDSLLGVKALRHASFRANRLCGKIPQGKPLNIFPPVAYAHNLCLCGKPLPPCKRKMGQ
ncbi:hypothetical protein SASPL_133062 [Salvia splendens]|uniref:Leucine-rich repeat-containing N-terminal plant-type domain-containing protein n=1 Tax=Salvia splendens TaxID=180675 RepID=A0A8X8X338_SALSN|nr:DNA damage-repair/toleration protein DRT100-like [Salvia splendens]KAG6405472.1 hypothetical protein SASPL_133062 [Salvia splendens]